MSSRYDQYSYDDFMNDPDFIRFVKYRGASDARIWEEWLVANPANTQFFHDAHRSLSSMLNALSVTPDPAAKTTDWAAINARIDRTENSRRIGRLLGRSMVAAAACIAILLSGYWFYNSRITIATGNAEYKDVWLPDHSHVKLNANSSLTWYRAWNWRKTREVWLKGEGLFDVTHLDQPPGKEQRFTAYAGDIVVKDLGTVFDIKQRRSKVVVTLIAGTISVEDRRRHQPPLILRPGEAVSFRDGLMALVNVSQMTSQPQAWVDRKIQANGITVQEIIDDFQDTYGECILLSDPKKLTKRIDGTLSLATREGTLYMLANILNADIHEQGDHIYLQLRK